MQDEMLKEQIKRKLPDWLRDDLAFRALVMDMTREEFANKRQTEGRFEAMLAELARDREEQTRKREEETSKWDQQTRKWEQENLKWEEQNREWDEQNRQWHEHARLWDEETRAWRQHEQEIWAEFRRLHEENRERDSRFDRSIGALGSRWGMQSERAFRDALASILEKTFDVQVVNVNEYDDEDEVFGRPDQVELDVIIKNGLLILCELKSSIDKAGMYGFERKARFYEKRHGRTASRLLVISPMIDARAKKVAERLGSETFGDSLDVKTL